MYIFLILFKHLLLHYFIILPEEDLESQLCKCCLSLELVCCSKIHLKQYFCPTQKTLYSWGSFIHCQQPNI